MRRSNLHRGIKSVIGKSASSLITEIRLGKAMDLLKESDLTISEVAYRVGFGSATYFTKCFHDHFGFPPGEVGKEGSFTADQTGSQEKRTFPRSRKKKLPLPWMITGIAI